MKTLKNLINITLSILLISVIWACEGKSKNSLDESADESSPEPSCIADFIPNNEIEKMITAEQVALIVKEPVESLEYSESKSSSAKYSTFGYAWGSDDGRTMTMEMEVAGKKISQSIILDDRIDIGNVEVIESGQKTPLEYFDFIYAPKTKEQKEAAKKAIDRASVENDKVDKKSAESIKSMLDKEKGLFRLDDIGDRAYWNEGNYYGKTEVNLKVLDGNTMFIITTDVSTDTQEDIRIAKEIAKQIIDNCN